MKSLKTLAVLATLVGSTALTACATTDAYGNRVTTQGSSRAAMQGAVAGAALGALVCWLATCYFSWQSFRAAGARASKQVLSNMYKGLMGKFAIVIVGFILILSNVKPLSAVALFCGFILVQAMSWVAPFWASRLQK